MTRKQKARDYKKKKIKKKNSLTFSAGHCRGTDMEHHTAVSRAVILRGYGCVGVSERESLFSGEVTAMTSHRSGSLARRCLASEYDLIKM